MDSEFHRHLQWALQHDISELDLELRFALESQFCGQLETFELCPNGQHQQVEASAWDMIPSAGTCFARVKHSDFNARNRDSEYQGTAGFHFFFSPKSAAPSLEQPGFGSPWIQCFSVLFGMNSQSHMGMQVTESNKHDYAKRLAQLRTTEAIRPQLTVFLEGFHQFIPRPLLKVFDTHELQVRPSHRTQQHRHARASISFRSRYPRRHRIRSRAA